MKVFSAKNRLVHCGPYPVERLKRIANVDLSSVPDMAPLTFKRPEVRKNIVNAMGEYQAMLDVIRDGLINKVQAVIPQDSQTCADRLKAFGYFNDAAMISAEEYQRKLANGDLNPVHQYPASGTITVLWVEVSHVEKMTGTITKYEFKSLDGKELPPWRAGAHLDVLVAPEFLRQYSMSGDPANSERCQTGVLR